MELIGYVQNSWTPLIRPAPSSREWMDATPQGHAYRCLPLNIANAHGWEILSPIAFDAMWNGGPHPDSITLRLPRDDKRERVVSIFGAGVLTFHVDMLFRTPPGWNLWISGSPNRQKDGIQALGGVMETDWAPFSFTMNWRFTRPDHWVRFEKFEPMCFVFPVQRDLLEQVQPRLVPFRDEPELRKIYMEWSDSRSTFTERMHAGGPRKAKDQWQKHYMRGTDIRGARHIDDHRTKVRLRPFDTGLTPWMPEVPMGRDHDPDPEGDAAPAPAPAARPVAAQSAVAAGARDGETLARREWLLNALEAQRRLSPRLSGVPSLGLLPPEVFLDVFYANARPVLLTGALGAEANLARFGAEALKKAIGTKAADLDDGGSAPFDQFLRAAAKAGAAPRRIASQDSARNARILAPLLKDLAPPYLAAGGAAAGAIAVAAPRAVERLAQGRDNRLTVQLAGKRRFALFAPAESANLYETEDGLSEIEDLDGPDFSLARHPRVAEARVYEVTLAAGDALFLPLGWWRQATAVDLSVSATYSQMAWPNP